MTIIEDCEEFHLLTTTHGEPFRWFRGLKALKWSKKPSKAHLIDEVARLKFERDHDELTELPNRRKFREDFERNLQEGSIVFMMDLNDFKGINDRFGHDVGDAKLRKVARHLMVLALQSGGVCCRLGGDEFAGLLPPGALPFLMEFQEDIGEETACIGFCVAQHGWDMRECLGRADAVLLLMKSHRKKEEDPK